MQSIISGTPIPNAMILQGSYKFEGSFSALRSVYFFLHLYTLVVDLEGVVCCQVIAVPCVRSVVFLNTFTLF